MYPGMSLQTKPTLFLQVLAQSSTGGKALRIVTSSSFQKRKRMIGPTMETRTHGQITRCHRRRVAMSLFLWARIEHLHTADHTGTADTASDDVHLTSTCPFSAGAGQPRLEAS